MSDKKLFTILKNSTAVSASFNVDSNIEDMSGFSVQAKWANQAGLAGSMKLQCSNDGILFEDISGATVTFSGNGTKIWNITDSYFRFARVVTTLTGGSADFYINIFARA